MRRLLAVLAPSLACAPPAPRIFHEVAFESELVEYRPDPALPLCAGSWAFVDAFAEAFVATLPAGTDLDGPITYQYLSEQEIADACPPELEGCAGHGIVYAPDAINLHEIVHALRQRAYGGELSASPLLEEGLAVYYHSADAGSHEFGALDVSELGLAPPMEMLTLQQYAGAGHFTSFFHTRVSPQQYQAFITSYGEVEGLGLDGYAVPYAEATGREWAGDLAAYQDSPDCPMYAFANRPVECTVPPAFVLEAGDAPATGMVEIDNFSCADRTAIGPDLGRVWGYLVVDNASESDRSWLLSLDSSDPDDALFRADIAPCGGGCLHGEASFGFTDTLGEQIEVRLAPGKSVLRFAISASSTVDLRVTLAPVEGADGGDEPTGSDPPAPPTKVGELWCTRAVDAEYFDPSVGWLPLQPYLPDVDGGPEGCSCIDAELVELLDALDETGAGEVVIDDDAYWRLVVRRQWAQEAAREECAALAPTPDHNCQADDLFDTHPMAGIQHAPLYRGSRVTGEVACRL